MAQEADKEIAEVVTHLDALIQCCGFDHSESGTEAFVYRWAEAVQAVKEEIDESHRQGLCLDYRYPLAERLLQRDSEE